MMKTEAEKWHDRYLLQKQGMDTIRRELGIGPDASIVTAIRRLQKQARRFCQQGAARAREQGAA